MVVQYLLEHTYAEGLHVDAAILPSVERLVLIVENFMHHTIDTSASHHINFHLLVVFVPNVLNVAGNREVDFDEILEFVKNQGEMILLAITHQLFKELGKCLQPTENLKPQCLLGSLLKLACQYTLVVFRNIEVEERLIAHFGTLPQHGGFADSTSSCDYRQSTPFCCLIPICIEYIQLFIPVVESHITSINLMCIKIILIAKLQLFSHYAKKIMKNT